MGEPVYFTPEYPDGLTRGQFRRLPRGEKLSVMEAWFRERYEDPANQTPYSSEDGGYQYIWGGPYDAADELWAEFEGISARSLIDDLTARLSDECNEWAPIPADDEGAENEPSEFDQFDLYGILIQGDGPYHLGSAEERAAREATLAAARAVRQALREYRRRHGMIGHNRPPEAVDPLSIGERERGEVEEAANEIEAELTKPEPDVRSAFQSFGKVRRVLQVVATWAGAKLNIAADAASKSFGTAVGTAAGTAVAGAGTVVVAKLLGMYGPLVEAVSRFYEAGLNWLGSALLPF